jgi:2-polyprenyl-6-methoxyphenol hydroxylase-like FAD-dependent oxidoreductase
VLALWLNRLGARVRVVDKAPEPGTTSRALAVQARTLELYRQMGLAAPVVEQGVPARALNIWAKGEPKGRIELEPTGKDVSPFPYVLVYPQDAHEKFLTARLAAAGVAVERPVELVEMRDEPDRMVAHLRRHDGSVETCEAPFVAGCDGARSVVRESLRVGFPGGTYSHVFYVADVEATGPTMNGEVHIVLDDTSNFLLCFPMGSNRGRLVGTVHETDDSRVATLGWNDVSQGVLERARVRVDKVHWFSTYRVHHRVASAFRVGRAFLLGDAGHIHSPVGGQGMNTGIGDAINLAWKLAGVTRGRHDPRILDSYEEERIPFARRLVASTDRAFELVTADSPLAAAIRVGVAPPLLTTLFHVGPLRKFLFETVSQIGIHYRGSHLSEGQAGAVHGGDRLPWVRLGVGTDNFDPLQSLDWQVHVYGAPTSDITKACSTHHLPCHVFEWGPAAKNAGLAHDGVYLVRPDGYVALASEGEDAARKLGIYFATRGIRLPERAKG